MKTYYTEPKAQEQAVAVHCPVCGEHRVRPLWDCGSFAFKRCLGCGHVYQNPRPRGLDLHQRYDDAYAEYEIQNRDRYLNLMLLSLKDMDFATIEASIGTGGAFLDIGCATGALVEHLQAKGWRAEGVEPCAGAVEYATKRGLRVHLGTLDTVSLPPASYDVVHSSHVIEHVPDPDAFLSTIRRLLKPGGWCFCTTPNRDGWQARLFGSHWRSVIADHVHLFSLRSLRALMLSQGFVPEAWRTWGGLAEGMAPPWIKRRADVLAKRLGGGDVMIVSARRP